MFYIGFYKFYIRFSFSSFCIVCHTECWAENYCTNPISCHGFARMPVFAMRTNSLISSSVQRATSTLVHNEDADSSAQRGRLWMRMINKSSSVPITFNPLIHYRLRIVVDCVRVGLCWFNLVIIFNLFERFLHEW